MLLSVFLSQCRLLHPENGGSKVLQNDTVLQYYMSSQPRTPQYTDLLLAFIIMFLSLVTSHGIAWYHGKLGPFMFTVPIVIINPPVKSD